MKKIKAEALLPYAILFFQSFLLILLLIIGNHDPLMGYTNFILFLPVVALLILLPISWYAVYIIDAVVLFLVYYLNSFLTAVRGRPLNYMDIFCIKEGLRVSSGYKPVFNAKIGIALAITVLLTFLVCFVYHKTKKEKLNRKRKSLSGIICVVLSGLLLFYYNTFYFSTKSERVVWDEELFVKQNGVFSSLVFEYVSSKTVCPEGYSPQMAQNILDRYEADGSENMDNAPDKIYVVMNESLADYSLLGETNISADPLKKIHALNDNCFKGKCAVNVFGGNTCNTEFEFLTGNSLMFMPNSVPYIQFSVLKGNAIVKDMNTLDYVSTAVHPYLGQEWRRTAVYEQLGFSDFISGETFSDNNEERQHGVIEDNNPCVDMNGFISFGNDLEYVRIFVSDNDCYNKMLEKASNEKDFVFAVTIQNHGGYHIDFEDDNMVKYINKGEAETENYLNLTRISDDAFDKFLDKLRNSDERSVVLMFGDHQPAVNFDYYSEKYSENGNEYQKIADEYIVPYILWANYDMDWEAPDFVSVNYLSAVLKKNCDLPLTQFDQFRLDAMQEYPVITSHFAVDKNGEYCSPEAAEQAKIIQDYSVLQYNSLFDSAE